jgi:hypothetical protein
MTCEHQDFITGIYKIPIAHLLEIYSVTRSQLDALVAANVLAVDDRNGIFYIRRWCWYWPPTLDEQSLYTWKLHAELLPPSRIVWSAVEIDLDFLQYVPELQQICQAMQDESRPRYRPPERPIVLEIAAMPQIEMTPPPPAPIPAEIIPPPEAPQMETVNGLDYSVIPVAPANRPDPYATLRILRSRSDAEYRLRNMDPNNPKTAVLRAMLHV